MSEKLNEMSREQLVGEVLLVRSRLADAQARAERAEGQSAKLALALSDYNSWVLKDGSCNCGTCVWCRGIAVEKEYLTPAPQGRTDGERLDWLESQDFSLERQWNIKDCHPGGVRLDVTLTDEHWKFDTVRECIDAAMDATAPEVKGGGE